MQSNSFRNVKVAFEGERQVITGEARVYEGRFFYKILNENGTVINENVMHVKEGGPAWSPFKIAFNLENKTFNASKTLVLELYEYEQKDNLQTESYSLDIKNYQG